MELSRRRIAVIIFLFASFQFFHAFSPSGPFVVQIAISLGIPNKEFYSSIQTFRAWFLLPATVICGLFFEGLGYRAALFFLSATLAISEGLWAVAVWVNGGHDISAAILKSAWAMNAFSFAAGFIVNCSMFMLLPPKNYTAASSANSIAMMTGSLVSSFAGQGLVHVVPDLGYLIYITVGGVCMSALIVVIGMCTKVFPKREQLLTAKEWCSKVWSKLVFYHNSSTVLYWSAFSSTSLAIHTLVKGMWKSLFSDINPHAGRLTNGTINGITCGAAALSMFVLSILPRSTEGVAKFILCVFPFLSGAIFIVMSYMTSIPISTGLLILYNSLCECSLVMASVMMAIGINECEERRTDTSLAINEDVGDSVPVDKQEEEQVKVDEESVSDVKTENKEQEGDVEKQKRKLIDFMLVFTFNAIISIAIQDIFNFIAVVILKLNSRQFFVGFAAVSIALGSTVTTATICNAIVNRKR